MQHESATPSGNATSRPLYPEIPTLPAFDTGRKAFEDYCDARAVNHEAERAVIAALIRNPDGKEILRLGIAADLFDHPSAREAFAAITAFIADGVAPDAATLRSAVSDAALIEVETSLQECASAANLPVYVKLLKDCHRERQLQAARERLAKAAAAGAPDHELQAILESIRQAGASGGKSRFIDVAELCALPPTENWLIKGYLSTDSLSVLFGDPGCGKSFLAIDIACHVATGQPWRGQAVRQGKVLYIAGEGRNGLSRRFKAWFDWHGEPPRNIQICTAPIALADPASIAALVADLQAMPDPPALIVIDTVNRNFGPGDENATADMTKAVAGLDAIRTATAAALLGVHHSGHADKGRGRGSSVLRAAVDTEYAAEKFARTVQVRCTKAKDFDHPAPLAWTLEKQPLPWADADGDPLDSAVLAKCDAPDIAARSDRLPAAQRIALDCLQTALAEQGIEENGVVSVAEDQWRDAAYKAGISSSDKPQASRRAFQRAREELIAGKQVSTQNGRYWIPSPSGTKRYKAVHCTDVYRGEKGGHAVQSGTSSFRDVPLCTDAPNREPNDNGKNSSAAVDNVLAGDNERVYE